MTGNVLVDMFEKCLFNVVQYVFDDLWEFLVIHSPDVKKLPTF